MAKDLSAFDCDMLRTAFHKAVIEEEIPEHEWREFARLMINDLTGNSEVDPDLLDWIICK
jgi:hypothetical protein